MSDRVTQSYSDCDGRNEKSMQSVQSVWMAHWTRTSYNATAEIHNHGPNALGNKENDLDSKPLRSIVELETVSKLSKSVKRLTDSETHTFEVINESLRTSSRTIAKETVGHLALHSPSENVKTTFQDPMGCVKTPSYVSSRSIDASRPLLDNPSSLASHLVPYQDLGQYITKEGEKKPFISRSSLAAQAKVPRHHNFHNHSTSLVCEEKLESRPEPKRSRTPYLRQNDAILLDVPSTSSKHLPEFGKEEFKKVPSSFIRLFQNESSTSQVSESKESHPRSYHQQKLPHPLHNVERMRKSNTIDSVMGLASYNPHISQTTHSLLIAKRTDANLSEGNKVNGKRMWSESNGKASLSDHDIPSKSFGHHKGGMKLQPLDFFTAREWKGKIEDSKLSKVVLKNESSAETATLDMDVFQHKNQLSGISSSMVKKVNKMDRNSPPQLALDCSRKEVGHKRFDLDINLELPPPTDNVEPSSSRTQSLDMESILAHAERPNSSRMDLCPEGLLELDPGSRWVKRLKAGVSGSSAFGTKTSSFIGESSQERARMFLRKVTTATITSSEHISSKLHGKEPTAHDKTLGLAVNSTPSTSVIKKDLGLLTSHSWIQRLLHDKPTPAQKRPQVQPAVVCEPHSSKLELNDFQKKQLPSLGAMALMGKAMNGFQPCEIHRRGPLVVWNTRSF